MKVRDLPVYEFVTVGIDILVGFSHAGAEFQRTFTGAFGCIPSVLTCQEVKNIRCEEGMLVISV